ncbi:MAG: NAD-dependent epimerase [Flavobacterium sp. BFFFF2]|nr:MAG: NAD-dependent epimerase [Flavobacterium sp. BFFFF2]
MDNYFLVTGAAGFIGSKVAQYWVNAGKKVITIDNLSTGTVEAIPAGVVFIQGNLGDAALVDQLRAYDIEAIFHIAGQSSGEISFENPSYDLQSNTESTLLLLKLAKERGIKHFIYASTMSVYGNQDYLPVTEETEAVPVSFYACGKLASEQYLRIYSQLGVHSVALRLFNVYGPGQNLTNMKQGMVSIYLAQALNLGTITVKGSMDRFRDFVYIDDVVQAFVNAYDYSQSHAFGLFNVSSGIHHTVGQVVEALRKNFEQDIPVVEIQGTPGDQFGIFGSSWRAQNELNWKATMPFNEGMKNMVEWAKSVSHE